MRTSASFVGLVTLMAVVGTTAAPTGANRAVTSSGPQPSRSGVPVPVPTPKLPGRAIPDPDVNTCDCNPVSPGDIKAITFDFDGKVKDVAKDGQGIVPDADAHFDTDMNKLQPESHPEPQSQPQPQPQPQSQPQPQPQTQSQSQSEPQPSNEPEGHSPVNAGDCPDRSKLGSEGFKACATFNPDDGKECFDTIHHDAYKAGDEFKAAANVAFDYVHQVDDKSMNVPHDVEKGAYFVGKMDAGISYDAMKPTEGTYMPAIAAAKGDAEGTYVIKDI
ncbi:hypothetical protein FRC11_011123 [Ceratobasidium sp. 423]|nr:hypothetical protein FRC11_011123 [Ceratobasidium sp. 423]